MFSFRPMRWFEWQNPICSCLSLGYPSTIWPISPYKSSCFIFLTHCSMSHNQVPGRCAFTIRNESSSPTWYVVQFVPSLRNSQITACPCSEAEDTRTSQPQSLPCGHLVPFAYLATPWDRGINSASSVPRPSRGTGVWNGLEVGGEWVDFLRRKCACI